MRAALIQIQKTNGWSDRLMAEALGVTRARWQQIRTDATQNVTLIVAHRAAKTWPELREHLDAMVA